jgi:hypothetical protein
MIASAVLDLKFLLRECRKNGRNFKSTALGAWGRSLWRSEFISRRFKFHEIEYKRQNEHEACGERQQQKQAPRRAQSSHWKYSCQIRQ